MAEQMRVVTKDIDVPGIDTLPIYEQHGGYQALRTALGMEPAAVLDEVKASGLRGRGGAGFPTGMKWSFLAKGSPKPTYVVCNSDESEPGTFKDRMLMEKLPHRLVEGVLIAAYATGAKQALSTFAASCRWRHGKWRAPSTRHMPLATRARMLWAAGVPLM